MGSPVELQTLTPYLVVKDANAAIEFYKKAFGAEEVTKLVEPNSGQFIHGELKIGNSKLMLGEEAPTWGAFSPLALNGSPVTVHINVPNVDEVFKKAVDTGATALMPPEEMFWGDRYGKLKDPFGHLWSIATKVKNLSPEEIKAAAAKCFTEAGCNA